jgi:exonuclease III
LDYLSKEDPDIICLQETNISKEEMGKKKIGRREESKREEVRRRIVCEFCFFFARAR